MCRCHYLTAAQCVFRAVNFWCHAAFATVKMLYFRAFARTASQSAQLCEIFLPINNRSFLRKSKCGCGGFDFSKKQTHHMAATSASGLGADTPNSRLVIHAGEAVSPIKKHGITALVKAIRSPDCLWDSIAKYYGERVKISCRHCTQCRRKKNIAWQKSARPYGRALL